MDRIYLDYSADTPADERVLKTYCDTVRECFANPNSRHFHGDIARHSVERSLEQTASLLGVLPGEIIFTSGASESNNLAVKGFAHAARRRGKHIISTFLEHSSVSGALTFLQEQGWEIDLVRLRPDGMIDLEHLRSLLREDTVLCAVCAVDSELGTVQPVAEIARLLSEYPNCRFHLDATQAAGKIPLDLSGVHSASLAPHKFYGLNGCGVLVRREGAILEPLIHGGASTTLYRSGTPDAAAAAACAEALSIASSELERRYAYVSELNSQLREQLAENSRIRINSPVGAVPHILNISVSGIKGEEMRQLLDQHGVSVSVKSACSVANTPSRAVLAVTGDRKNALSSWRISLSHLTTAQELERFTEILFDIIRSHAAK